eukprot:scaffold604_cov384-Prasinococcus_capsulatus_cf.AAC.2
MNEVADQQIALRQRAGAFSSLSCSVPGANGIVRDIEQLKRGAMNPADMRKPSMVPTRNQFTSGEEPLVCWEVNECGKSRQRLVCEGEDTLVAMLDKQHDQLQRARRVLESFVLPEGYPESVSPLYTPYMQWRALQYLFGGAMSVFTTRSLLLSLGVSKAGAAPTAAAVNWVLRDGAGRVGKMLFARHGRKFDSDLKQMRFGADVLMELGAGVELATAMAPQHFLPLACLANLAKNVAAMTATSTRSPTYKSFAKTENIGDITAKGECVANSADIAGTALGIMVSRIRNLHIPTTFAILSTGYIVSSYYEVKAVHSDSFNKARFGLTVNRFFKTGEVMGPWEANNKEPVLPLPWAPKITLGSRATKAFDSASDFTRSALVFRDLPYILNYDKKEGRMHVVLKEEAGQEDIMKGLFHAHMVRTAA